MATLSFSAGGATAHRRQLDHECAGFLLAGLLLGPMGERKGAGDGVQRHHQEGGQQPAAQARCRTLEEVQMRDHGEGVGEG
ncbi:MAG: hypothetical protein M5U16_00305 [Hyphomicrobium sp.]|nr:hypothetical protein [Hyphomicrobium sp.]